MKKSIPFGQRSFVHCALAGFGGGFIYSLCFVALGFILAPIIFSMIGCYDTESTTQTEIERVVVDANIPELHAFSVEDPWAGSVIDENIRRLIVSCPIPNVKDFLHKKMQSGELALTIDFEDDGSEGGFAVDNGVPILVINAHTISQISAVSVANTQERIARVLDYWVTLDHEAVHYKIWIEQSERGIPTNYGCKGCNEYYASEYLAHRSTCKWTIAFGLDSPDLANLCKAYKKTDERMFARELLKILTKYPCYSECKDAWEMQTEKMSKSKLDLL